MTSDWRLTNQHRYLQGIALTRQAYVPADVGNDHEHCEFCFAKFTLHPDGESLHEGYASPDHRRWVCVQCFADFREEFGWLLCDGAEPMASVIEK